MPTPKYLRVKNWTRYQHYKDRRPTWIKLYNSLLDDYAFCSLPDASKAHFLCILLAASRQDNCIPLDAEWLARFMSATEPIDLQRLTAAGLLEPCSRSASKLLASRKHVAIPETETETETETEPPNPRRRGSSSVSPSALEELRRYEELSGWPANGSSGRSVQRLLDSGKGPDLVRAREAYSAELELKDSPREFRIRPHNWFGREARWEPYSRSILPAEVRRPEVFVNRKLTPEEKAARGRA